MAGFNEKIMAVKIKAWGFLIAFNYHVNVIGNMTF